MFLPSQLVEIAHRFHADVEDLQVLLQEEGLPAGSAACLEILAARLNSDARFRGDLAFLMRSMLHREPEEAGSMDVLGVLVVAAAGIQPELGTIPRQTLLRELLRFVMQQRRRDIPSAAVLAEAEAGAVLRNPITPVADRVTAVANPVAAITVDAQRPPLPAVHAAAPAEVQTAPDADAWPLLTQMEPEPWWRRMVPVVPLVLLALLIGLGAGLVLHHGPSGAAPPSETSFTVGPLPPSPVARPDRPSAPAASPQWKHTARKPLPVAPRASSHRPQPPQVSARAGIAATTPPNAVESHPRAPANPPRQTSTQPAQASTQPAQASTQHAQTSTQPAQPLNGSPSPPVLQRRNPAATMPPANPARQPNAPISVGNVFAHPEADTATAGQPPPTVFSRPKDPVLIARNTPAAIAPAKPQIQGTVHLGSTGNMASNLMYSPEPEYPPGAIAAGVEGEVTIRAVVGPRGDVIDERVVSGPPLLRDAALEAVGRWRYRPYEQDGKPVAVATTAIVDFQMPPKK